MISAIGSELATWHPPPRSYDVDGRTNVPSWFPSVSHFRRANPTTTFRSRITGHSRALAQPRISTFRLRIASARPRRGEGSPALAGEEAELAEEVHLVEEQVLGLQRVAVGDVNRRPPELDGSSCRRDIAVGGVEHTIMGAREGPFGRCGRPVGEELRDLEAEVRERFLEHGEEADDIVAAADLGAWRCHLRIGRPWIGVAVTAVDRVDVLEDHLAGARHLLSRLSLECDPLRSPTFASDEKQKRRDSGT